MTTDQFINLLYQRTSHQRKLINQPLLPLTQAIVRAVVEQQFLMCWLDEQIDQILKDCEIFHNMSEQKAVDTLFELASIASLYVNRDETTYQRICKQIEQIRRSYPN